MQSIDETRNLSHVIGTRDYKFHPAKLYLNCSIMKRRLAEKCNMDVFWKKLTEFNFNSNKNVPLELYSQSDMVN